jgi:hypothetical protein
MDYMEFKLLYDALTRQIWHQHIVYTRDLPKYLAFDSLLIPNPFQTKEERLPSVTKSTP